MSSSSVSLKPQPVGSGKDNSPRLDTVTYAEAHVSYAPITTRGASLDGSSPGPSPSTTPVGIDDAYSPITGSLECGVVAQLAEQLRDERLRADRSNRSDPTTLVPDQSVRIRRSLQEAYHDQHFRSRAPVFMPAPGGRVKRMIFDSQVFPHLIGILDGTRSVRALMSHRPIDPWVIGTWHVKMPYNGSHSISDLIEIHVVDPSFEFIETGKEIPTMTVDIQSTNQDTCRCIAEMILEGDL